uniref:hypothetical protein n=1 Tax=Photorhabdus australis TaxID=286156 RepID=UPI001F23B3F0
MMTRETIDPDKEVNVGLLPTRITKDRGIRSQFLITFIPVIFQVASLLAALTHPGHIVCYAPEDSLPCRR